MTYAPKWLLVLRQACFLQRGADVRDALLGVGQSRGFFWVLLGFKHDPAGIALKLVEHRDIVDRAVARHGVDAELLALPQDPIEEAPIAGVGFAHLRLAHVLAVHMADARTIGARQPGGISAAPARMAGVEKQ